MATEVKTGRPLKYANKEELDFAITTYFGICEGNDEVPTMAGLAYHLGFLSRSSLFDYKERDEFSASIKRARLYIESKWESASLKGGGGVVFWMKNNAGYTDKSEQEVTQTVKNLTVEFCE